MAKRAYKLWILKLLEILCRMNAIVDKECSNQSVDVVKFFINSFANKVLRIHFYFGVIRYCFCC